MSSETVRDKMTRLTRTDQHYQLRLSGAELSRSLLLHRPDDVISLGFISISVV